MLSAVLPQSERAFAPFQSWGHNIDSPEYLGDQAAVQTVNFIRWIDSEEGQGGYVSQRGHSDYLLGYSRCNPHYLYSKWMNIQTEILSQIIGRQDKAEVHTRVVDSSRFKELGYNLPPLTPYSLYLALSDFFLDLNSIDLLGGKTCCPNNKIVAETNVYFGLWQILWVGMCQYIVEVWRSQKRQDKTILSINLCFIQISRTYWPPFVASATFWCFISNGFVEHIYCSRSTNKIFYLWIVRFGHERDIFSKLIRFFQ